MSKTPFVAAALVAVSLAACGGSGTESETAGTTSQAAGSSFALPAEQAAAMKAGTGVDPLTRPATLDELKQRVEQYRQPLSELLVTEPVSKPAAPGKRIAALTCGVPVCGQITAGMQEAGKELGWDVMKVDLGVSPQEFAAAWTRAIQLKPDMVITSGLSRELFEKQLQELKAMNVPVLNYAGPDPAENGITWTMLDAPTYYAAAQMISEEIAADGELKANVVMFNVSQYAGSTALAESIKSYLPKLCPDCALDYQLAQVTEVGKLGQKVTGYVQSHPDTTHVICTFGDLCQGVGQALRAAGRKDIKIVSKDATSLNYANVQAGSEWAVVPLPNAQTGWQLVDAMQRIFNGDDLEATRLLPQQFVTDIADPENPDIGAVADFRDKYRSLWGL